MLALVPILSEYGVPYVRLTPRGGILEVSEAASRQLGANAALVLSRIQGFVRDLAAVPARARTGATGPTARTLDARIGLPHCGALRVRSVQLTDPSGDVEVLVVLSAEALDPVRQLFDVHHLTDREREVAAHLSTGRGLPAVAAELAISVHTARRHTEKVYAKLGVHSRAELARWMGALSQK